MIASIGSAIYTNPQNTITTSTIGKNTRYKATLKMLQVALKAKAAILPNTIKKRTKNSIDNMIITILS